MGPRVCRSRVSPVGGRSPAGGSGQRSVAASRSPGRKRSPGRGRHRSLVAAAPGAPAAPQPRPTKGTGGAEQPPRREGTEGRVPPPTGPGGEQPPAPSPAPGKPPPRLRSRGSADAFRDRRVDPPRVSAAASEPCSPSSYSPLAEESRGGEGPSRGRPRPSSPRVGQAAAAHPRGGPGPSCAGARERFRSMGRSRGAAGHPRASPRRPRGGHRGWAPRSSAPTGGRTRPGDSRGPVSRDHLGLGLTRGERQRSRGATGATEPRSSAEM